jgi:ATP-binding cassette subfamily B protein
VSGLSQPGRALCSRGSRGGKGSGSGGLNTTTAAASRAAAASRISSDIDGPSSSSAVSAAVPLPGVALDTALDPALDTAQTDRRFFAHVMSLALPERPRLAAGLGLLGASSLISLAVPRVAGNVLDLCLAADAQLAPHDAALGLFALVSIQSVLIAARSYLLTVAGERVSFALRRRALETLLRQELAFFDQAQTGELLNRLSADAAALQRLLTTHLVTGSRALVMLTGCTAMMVSISPSLCLVATLAFPPAVLISRATGRRIKARQQKVQDSLAAAAAEGQRALGALSTLRLFSAEEAAGRRYEARLRTALDEATAVGALSASMEAGVSWAMHASLLGVMAAGGQQVISGALSYGDLSAFLMYTIFLGFNAGNVGSVYAEVQRAAGASRRLLELLDLPGMRQGGALPSLETSHADAAALELRDVHFAYPSRADAPVLSGVSLSIRRGERVAIVGSSGSGKSTVAALAAGLYSANRGAVRVHGHDIEELDGSALRAEWVATMPQDPVLLSGTLRENVALGRPEASEDQLRTAARLAGCDFAERIWEREVGEQGVQLSGGQRQRVALARVLLRDAPIVLLDEFSSALDAATEAALVETLHTALAGRTLVLITHRSSTLELVDRVVELSSGRVVSDRQRV